MKRGTPEHPKVFLLCDELHCRRPAAIGYLTLLWEFAAKYAKDGNVGRYPDKRVEAAMDWRGRTGALTQALHRSGWLDAHEVLGWCIHDWHEHAEEYVLRYLRRLKIPTVTGQSFRAKLTGQMRTTDGQIPVDGCNLSEPTSLGVRLPLPLAVPLPVSPPSGSPPGGTAPVPSSNGKPARRRPSRSQDVANYLYEKHQTRQQEKSKHDANRENRSPNSGTAVDRVG